ncbi:MAG: RecX family transcriptional regulator [Saprospiraceae bacterium]|jgi:regulatory protein|nr:RecX family transcriptional regulator [Saprospiraceae bacterium]MBK6481004.1 RecX family transcriptional regulator [Saprospiraceae bacterium]MBK6815595.1 RecX family transcriptional regulator [Saprospiraceae bacterium]MBK7373975.1 RecX family transcriptional regulator [Saprospiraceae bacterium]MBK7439260.1 RecX family transcriptional regulator [Saprospiraceae bacterium]
MAVSLTVQEGISLMRQYCNYQERCHQDVRTKGLKLGFRGDDLEEIISTMITEKLLDEERYARALARGKFRNNEWGKIKIKQALKLHAVPDYCIKKAMLEIDPEEYTQVVKKLAENKSKLLSNEKDRFKKKKKIADYLLQKGFEYEIITQTLGEED